MSNYRAHSSVVIISLTLLQVGASAQTGTFVDKFASTDLRVVSYNVLWNTIFPDQGVTAERFDRVVNALQPDILNLQEITRSAEDVRLLMNAIAPLPGNASWFTTQFSDNVIVSKFPFLLTDRAGRGGVKALIDLPDTQYAKDLFVINDHWPCCRAESSRQFESDWMVTVLEDAKTVGGEFDIPQNTPMLMLGDLNIVESGQPLQTILTGDIQDEATFGPDSPPDWDGTSLTDANPPHNGRGPEDWTWRDDSQVFDPGILDFILYTDSVLDTANKFVLNTTKMTTDELTATGLQTYDVVIDERTGNFDHIPVVVDFRIIPEPASLAIAMLGVSLTFTSVRRQNRVTSSPGHPCCHFEQSRSPPVLAEEISITSRLYKPESCQEGECQRLRLGYDYFNDSVRNPITKWKICDVVPGCSSLIYARTARPHVNIVLSVQVIRFACCPVPVGRRLTACPYKSPFRLGIIQTNP